MFYNYFFKQQSWNELIQHGHYHQDLQLRHEPIKKNHHHQNPQLLPSSFKLQTPPMGRRGQKNLETPQNQAEQRAEAVSKLKLLPTPGQVREQVRSTNTYTQTHTQTYTCTSPRALQFLECCGMKGKCWCTLW